LTAVQNYTFIQTQTSLLHHSGNQRKDDFKSKFICISAKSLQVILVLSCRLQVVLVPSWVRLANQSHSQVYFTDIDVVSLLIVWSDADISCKKLWSFFTVSNVL